MHLPPGRVEGEVADAQDVAVVLTGDAAASQQCAQPGEELVEREGLHQVVVGARVETRHPVAHLVARGEHQHGGAVAALAELPARSEAVDVGHEHVEHDDVGVGLDRCEQRLGTVGCGVDLVALEGERPDERVAHAAVVLGDEHAAEGGRGSVVRHDFARPRE